MNKILRYSLSVAFACVASLASAQEPVKVLTFPDDNNANNKVNGYNQTWTAKMGDDEWTLTNFNNNKWNNWDYVRCVSKNAATVATIKTPVIDKSIGYIVFDIDNIDESIASDENFRIDCSVQNSTSQQQVVIRPLYPGQWMLDLTVEAPNTAYTINFNCPKGSKNGLLQLSKVALYETGQKPEINVIENEADEAYSVETALGLFEKKVSLCPYVYVKGVVSAIDDISTQYGNATYTISDEGKDNKLKVYRGMYIDGQKFTDANALKVGDKVTLYGQLTAYKSTKDNVTTTEYQLANSCIDKLNDPTTGIADVTVAPAAADAPLYNLAGQKVSKDYKGVVIKAGKKMILK